MDFIYSYLRICIMYMPCTFHVFILFNIYSLTECYFLDVLRHTIHLHHPTYMLHPHVYMFTSSFIFDYIITSHHLSLCVCLFTNHLFSIFYFGIGCRMYTHSFHLLLSSLSNFLYPIHCHMHQNK